MGKEAVLLHCDADADADAGRYTCAFLFEKFFLFFPLLPTVTVLQLASESDVHQD